MYHRLYCEYRNVPYNRPFDLQILAWENGLEYEKLKAHTTLLLNKNRKIYANTRVRNFFRFYKKKPVVSSIDQTVEDVYRYILSVV